MASSTRSTKLPYVLAEAAEIRAKALGYASWNAYIKGLIRYDLLIQGPHTVTLPLSHSRPEEQDRVDWELLDRVRTGVGSRGQYLENLVREVAGEHADTVKAGLTKALVRKASKKPE